MKRTLLLFTLLLSACNLPDFAASAPAPSATLGLNADTSTFRPCPDTHAWNLDVSKYPVDPMGATYLTVNNGTTHPMFGGKHWAGGPNGIPYYVTTSAQPKVPIRFKAYPQESDPGPYPLPADPKIIQWGGEDTDRHVIVVDREKWVAYEMWRGAYDPAQGWSADSGAIHDLKKCPPRRETWTSANAAGVSEFVGLVKYDEVAKGEIRHAIAFTVQYTQQGYIAPATHAAGTCGANPASTDRRCMPMGARWRLRASFACDKLHPQPRVICQALQKYGMILIDNGANFDLAGAPDPRWKDDHLVPDLRKITGSDYELVKTGEIIRK